MANIYGIDPGTCNLKIYSKHNNKIIKEKNAIAILDRDLLYACGDEAYAMYEKVPRNIRVSFPITGGVISDYNDMQANVLSILEKHNKGHIRGAQVVVSVPTDITEVEKKAFFDLFYKSKMRPKMVLLCDKPIAAAVGLGIDVTEPTGIMIVDIGADTTDISVISLGGLVISNVLHFGSKRLDENIISYIKKTYNISIGQKTAISLKESIASALPGGYGKKHIFGIDVVSGLPVELDIQADVVYEAIKDSLSAICNAVKLTLENTPPELAKDIKQDGIHIIGGGSELTNMDKLLKQISGIAVNTCEDPDEAIVRGLRMIVTNDKYKHLAYNMKPKFFR